MILKSTYFFFLLWSDKINNYDNNNNKNKNTY